MMKRRKEWKEHPEFLMEDGAHTIFLSTKGNNDEEVPKELVNFLKYVEAPLSESERDFEDAFVSRLQKAVKEVKVSREMGARYMTFQELLKDERKEEARYVAHNFFENGASYELVRASIECLSDTELQQIYKEVCRE